MPPLPHVSFSRFALGFLTARLLVRLTNAPQGKLSSPLPRWGCGHGRAFLARNEWLSLSR